MTYVIAEVGSNWATFEDCKNSISLAKNCGADAVKFQLFNPVALYGDIPATWGMPIRTNGEGPYMPHDWLPKLKEKADACGIDFMCTAFSPELIDVVDPFVKIHKVASAELTHVRLLEKLKKIGKPVILSTGASGAGDIRMALETLGGTPVRLMHCVAAYPARATNLERITLLKNVFGKEVGYSDHSISCDDIPLQAVKLGAVAIEKHVNFVGASGPDAPHSLDTVQFQHMVKVLRGQDSAYCEENEMHLQHNRRLIATRDIAPGEVLQENENFGIFRALKHDSSALSPWLVNQVNGKLAKKEIKAGQGIGPSDL